MTLIEDWNLGNIPVGCEETLLIERDVRTCRAILLYDWTTYDFRVRERCQDPVLDVNEYDEVGAELG